VQLSFFVISSIAEGTFLLILLLCNKSSRNYLNRKFPNVKFIQNMPTYRLDLQNPLFYLQIVSIFFALGSAFFGFAANNLISINDAFQCSALQKLSVASFLLFNAALYAFFWVKIKISNVQFGKRPAEKLISCLAITVVPVFVIWTLVQAKGLWLTSPQSTCVCMTQLVEIGSILFCTFDLMINITFLYMFISALVESLHKNGVIKGTSEILTFKVSDHVLNSPTEKITQNASPENGGKARSVRFESVDELSSEEKSSDAGEAEEQSRPARSNELLDSKETIGSGKGKNKKANLESSRGAKQMKSDEEKLWEIKRKSLQAIRKNILATLISLSVNAITVILLTVKDHIHDMDFSVSIFSFSSTGNLLIGIWMMHYSTTSAWSNVSSNENQLTGRSKTERSTTDIEGRAEESWCPLFRSPKTVQFKEKLIDKLTVSRVDL
jgi:hypothetical protein